MEEMLCNGVPLSSLLYDDGDVKGKVDVDISLGHTLQGIVVQSVASLNVWYQVSLSYVRRR